MGKFSQNAERYSGKKKPQAGVTAALALLVVVLRQCWQDCCCVVRFPLGRQLPIPLPFPPFRRRQR